MKRKTDMRAFTELPALTLMPSQQTDSHWLIMVIELSGVQFGLKSYA